MVARLAKNISPKKLKVKEVRLNILNELRAEGRLIKGDLAKTTATWKGAKPTFEFAIGLTGKDALLLVGPSGNQEGAQKWVWLNEGTKPHVIRAKNVPNLKFRTTFVPKTKVKTFSSGAGQIAPPWRSTPKVNHPGIEARDWTGEIAKQRQKPFAARMRKAAKV